MHGEQYSSKHKRRSLWQRARLYVQLSRQGGSTKMAVVVLVLVIGCATLILKQNRQRDVTELTTVLEEVSSANDPSVSMEEDIEEMDLGGHPLTSSRPPSTQFGHMSEEEVILTVIVYVHSDADASLFNDTLVSVISQSLRNIEVLVIGMNVTESHRVIMNSLTSSMRSRIIFPFEFLNDQISSRYFAFIAAGDLIELNTLESAVWALECSPHLDAASSFSAEITWKNSTSISKRGFHQGEDMVRLKNLPTFFVASLRILRSICAFRVPATITEQARFWQCLADTRTWGLTIPLPLHWSRQQIKFREEYEKYGSDFESKHPEYYSSFRSTQTTALPIVNLTSPFDNPISRFGRSILFLVPWLPNGGSEIVLLRIVKEFIARKWRATIVCTLHDSPSSNELRPKFLKLTHDIHVLPAIIPLKDAPRFLAYLIESRGISLVYSHNTQTGYTLIPLLKYLYPHVHFIDYIHNVLPSWKDGGFSRFSTAVHDSISLSFVTSDSSRASVIQMGMRREKVVRCYVGVEVIPVNFKYHNDFRSELGIADDVIMVVMTARLVASKRPDFAIEVLAEVAMQRPGERIAFYMIGDGPRKSSVLQRAQVINHLSIHILGSLEHERVHFYLQAADLFILPTLIESVSMAITEAMLYQVPIITSDLPGTRELIGSTNCATLIPMGLPAHDEKSQYVQALHQSLENRQYRRYEYGPCYARVVSEFNSGNNTAKLVATIEKLPLIKRVPRSSLTALANAFGSYAIESIREFAPIFQFSDRYEIEERIISPSARLLQYCKPSDANQLTWYQSLLSNRVCIGGTPLPLRNVISAIRQNQCYRKCIYDPTSTSILQGWTFSSNCWSSFGPSHPCARDWPEQRPWWTDQ